MIEIKIHECKFTDNPLAAQKRLSQVEMFLEGFKELCNKTGMHKVDMGGIKATGPFPIRLNFDDGTYIGTIKMFQEIGFDYDK